MAVVYRKQKIEGVTVPAIIHNSNYFLIQMGVYEDGTISCWDKCDLNDFISFLKRGRVVTSVPEGRELSVYGLGDYKVKSANWYYDTDSFDRHIKDVVRTINPEMANIYHTTQREREKWQKARVGFSPTAIPFKIKGQIGYNMIEGKSSYIFYRDEKGQLYITTLTVFSDKSVQLEITGDKEYSLEETEALIKSGTLTISPKGEEKVIIKDLGELVLSEDGYCCKPAEKIKEIRELALELAGEQDAIDRCRHAHYLYLCDPNDWTRENLRKAYEAVPEHQRMFLGDMDTRDADFIRILYRPEEKREV
ncbi:MAG: hypothetical protein HDT44_11060 [Ruminococcaceae bacterium]|nr:hypothetical protein [Oscillospiraceae bacterium]